MLNKTVKIGGVLLGLGLLMASRALADDRVILAGHVPKILESAVKLERVSADEQVQMSLVLRVDQDLLTQTLENLYGPHAPAQKHFLSSSEFAQQFGLADKREKIKEFARANGFTVDTSDDRSDSMVVKVSAQAGVVENAFGVQLNHYRGADGRVFRSNNTDPLIPASLAPHLSAILGLSNNTGVLHPHIRAATRTDAATPSISGATGPGGALAPADIKTIYALSQTAHTGSGQTVALVELDGYAPSDISLYKAEFSLPNITVTPVSVDSTPNLCGTNQNLTCNAATESSDSGMDEVALDVDMVMALAPGVSQILVYEGINTLAGGVDVYNRIATDNTAKVISTSWGQDEQDLGLLGLTFSHSESPIFQKMATQGQTFYAASGDCGAYGKVAGNSCITNAGFHVDDPAAQPYVTGVGGTSLSGTLLSPTEVVWDTTHGSGGGVSTDWTGTNFPSYQVGVAGTASQTGRNIPDVALNSDPSSPYAICVAGTCSKAFGGTSAAAPLWAAFTALINQQRVTVGLSTLGFANPTLYPLGTGSSYHSLFNDITSGNNGLGGAGFNAGSGYDNTTGFGSFKGDALISALSVVPPSPAPPPPPTPVLPPVLILQPVSQSVNLGETATFSIQATGSGLTYQWEEQPSGNGSFTVIAGATNSGYSTPPLTVGDNQTQFECVVANTAGSVTSNAATLTTITPTGLSAFLVYPNPWDVRKHAGVPIHFAGLPDGATVNLFTISAHHVRTLAASGGKADWDLTNDSGQAAASGYYLYIITNNQGSKTTGKIAVIR